MSRLIRSAFTSENFSLSASKEVRGVTLIELMVTLAVLVILASLAIPSFQGSLASSRVSSTANELISSIAQARSHAIKIGSRVTLCKSADGATCSTSGNWEQGWIMLKDTVRAGSTATFDVGDELIRNYQISNISNISVKGNAALDQYISYGADGTGKTIAGAPLVGKIRVCSVSSALKDSERARDLVMSFTGRVILEKPSVDATCPAPT
jgi:type IV fimbrial biogenesis protein FimT